jgi:hypothetical protein
MQPTLQRAKADLERARQKAKMAILDASKAEYEVLMDEVSDISDRLTEIVDEHDEITNLTKERLCENFDTPNPWQGYLRLPHDDIRELASWVQWARKNS